MKILIVVVLLVLIIGFIKFMINQYSRNSLSRKLKSAMTKLFLEKQIEKVISLPLDSGDYATIVNNGLKSLIGPGYRAGVLHCRKNKIYLTIIHLSGDIESLTAFMKLIDYNRWLEIEVDCLKHLFISNANFGKLLHYELSFHD